MIRLQRWLVPLAAALIAVPPWLLAQTPPRAPVSSAPRAGADAGASTASATPAGGEQEITLQNLEAHLLPIAIPAMRGDASSSDVTSVLTNDLRLSAMFRVIDPTRFTANLEAEGLNISPPAWLQVGATSVEHIDRETSRARMIDVRPLGT
jgi:hypothetical protein